MAVFIVSILMLNFSYKVFVSLKQVMSGKALHVVGSLYTELFLSLLFDKIIKNNMRQALLKVLIGKEGEREDQ